MEIFGLTFQELLFFIFLPFLFFYLLIYALLKKTKILGEGSTLNNLISLLISALGIFSLYNLGLSFILPYLAALTAVSAFIILYFFGILSHAMKKTTSYVSGKAFMTEDEKNFEASTKKCQELWEKFAGQKDPKILEEMKAEVEKLELLAKKLDKNLNEYAWYQNYKSTVKE